MTNTVEVINACLDITKIANGIDETNKLLNKHNQLLEELVNTLKDNKEGGTI